MDAKCEGWPGTRVTPRHAFRGWLGTALLGGLLGACGSPGAGAPTAGGASKKGASDLRPTPTPHDVRKHSLKRIEGAVSVTKLSTAPFAELDAALGPPGSTAIADALAKEDARTFEQAMPTSVARLSPDGATLAVRALSADRKRGRICLVRATGLVRPCFEGADPVWAGPELVYVVGRQLHRLAPTADATPAALGQPLSELCVERSCERVSEVIAVDSALRTALVRDHGRGFVDSSEIRRIDLGSGKSSAVFTRSASALYLSSLVADDGTACAYRMFQSPRGSDPDAPQPAELLCAASPWARTESVLWSDNGAPAVMTGASRSRIALGLTLTLVVIDAAEKVEHRYEPAGLRFSSAWAIGDGKTVALASDTEVGFANLDDETLLAGPLKVTGIMEGLPTKLRRALIVSGEERWVAAAE